MESAPHIPPKASPYQKIERVLESDSVYHIHENQNQPNMDHPSKLRHFHCQFDPRNKHGRSLVLKFDIMGDAYFEEMSRLDVLKLAEEAAKPQQTTVLEPKTYKRERSETGAHGAVCDVQRVHARDIRKLDNVFAVSNEPAIVVRKQAILVNADPIRALILRDVCLVFVPDGADSLLSLLKEKFHEANQDTTEQPYEFRALEALLATLCRIFESDYERMAPFVTNALDRLASGKTGANELETLRVYKNTINEFESQVDGVRRALMEILDNEEDLRLLFLTKLHEDPALLLDLWSFDSEEAEGLVENYLQDIYTTRTKASLMQHRIQNTESLVMIKLDCARNYLLGVELVFSLVALAVSLGTYVTGIFGMNLESSIPGQSVYFYSVVVFTLIAIVVIVGFGIVFFQRQGVFLR